MKKTLKRTSGKAAGWYLVLLVAAAIASGLAARGEVLGGDSAPTLVARAVSETPSLDPEAALWGRMPAVEVPLSGQQIVIPRGGGSIRSLQVRAAHDGKSLFLHLKWRDPTRDERSLAAEQFTDAVAVQFPEKSVTFAQLCMGTLAYYLNIWQWRADRQADQHRSPRDIERQYPGMHWDYYPFGAGNRTFAPGRAAGNVLSLPPARTPVQALIAGGAGSLTARPPEEQAVAGMGVWRDGYWQVVLSRALQSSAPHDVRFAPGKATVIALAVWDGSRKERGSEKAVANWLRFALRER